MAVAGTNNSADSSPVLKILSAFLWLRKYSDVGFALSVIGIISVLIIPVPKMLLDLLLGVSITFSVLVLMTVLFLRKPLDFSAFPTILLIAALFRLALNIASTRLILANGHQGPEAAGHVIHAFGTFVMEGSIVIGIIVFLILTIINFIVITKGSGRIAEVAARFTLDAMPGKQMAIDADLSAGLINEDQARQRRKELEKESGFYGSMDGANKFVRGDAIAGILITVINFIGGMVIGVVQRDMDFSAAAETYTILTIGDGLVSQIPALLVSTAAGLLVAKSSVSDGVDSAMAGQMGNPRALVLVAGLIGFMGLLPGIPALPFLFLASSMGGLAWYSNTLKKTAKETAGNIPGALKDGEKRSGAAGVRNEAVAEEEPISEVLQLDSVRLELGFGLLPLIDSERGNRLPDQVKALRKQLARDLGFVMPSVRIQDNMQLASQQYVIRVKDIECGRGEVRPEMLLVMDPKGGKVNLPGEETTEPAFGLPAKWVSTGARDEAMMRQYTVVDPSTVVTTHLTEIIREHITELLSYSETRKLLDNVSEENKKLIKDTIPEKLSYASVQRVLQNLLAEGVSIRDLAMIVEAMAEIAGTTKNISAITEHVRARLARQICHAHMSADGTIPVVALSSVWEQVFLEGLQGAGDEKQLSVPPGKLQEFIASVKRSYERLAAQGENPVFLVHPALRPYVRSVMERVRPSTIVLSQNEIHAKARLKTLGQV
jgi:flagellar biosynthesis protein FlhA